MGSLAMVSVEKLDGMSENSIVVKLEKDDINPLPPLPTTEGSSPEIVTSQRSEIRGIEHANPTVPSLEQVVVKEEFKTFNENVSVTTDFDQNPNATEIAAPSVETVDASQAVPPPLSKTEPVESIKTENSDHARKGQTAAGRKQKKDNLKDLQCSLCGKTFSIKWNLVAHLRIHTNERPYPCPDCAQRFRQYAHLQKHMRSVHPGTPIPLPSACKETAQAMSSRHPIAITPIIKKKKNAIIKAKRLKVKAKEKASISVSPKPEEDPYEKFKLRPCTVGLSRWDIDGDIDSSKTMSETLVLQKFQSMAANRQTLLLKVKDEDYLANLNVDVLNHFLRPLSPNLDLHNLELPPTLSELKNGLSGSGNKRKTFSRGRNPTSLLRKKMLQSKGFPDIANSNKRGTSNRHKSNKKFNCPDCGKTFDRQTSFVMHIRRAHPRTSDAFRFKRKRKMRRPLQHVQQKLKKMQCPVCHKVFLVTNKIQHMRIHTGERPYRCEICPNSSFVQKGSYNIHMRKMHGYRRCTQCGKTFPDAETLNDHVSSVH